MASRSTTQLVIARIRVRPGRRPLDEAHIANLMVSFQEIGQRTAISVRPVADSDPERSAYANDLVAGGHRLEAARRLGWRVIDAVVEDEPELAARIAEVDENLIRRDLNPLERAMALAARLEAWSARYPDRIVVGEDGTLAAKRGRPKKLPHGAAITAPPTMGFSEDAAKTAGLSKDTVERALAVYRGIPASLQDRLLGTPIASNPGVLRQLANLVDKDEQRRVADVLLDGKTKSVSDAMAIAAGNAPSRPAQTPVDATVKAFLKVWGDATPSGRDAILHALAGDRRLPKSWIVRSGDHG